MSQEANSRSSYPAWGLPLALIVLAGLLVLNLPALSRATADNQATIALLRDWSRKPKDISQILCDEQSTPRAVPAAEEDQTSLVNAARRAHFAGNCELALAYWTLAAENDPQSETLAIMRLLSGGLDRDLLPQSMSAAETAVFLEELGLWAEQDERPDHAAYWFARSFEIRPSRDVADNLVPLQEGNEERTAAWQQLADTLPEDDPDHWWARGQEAELASQWEEAVDYYGSGAQIAPDPFEFLMAQGEVLLKLDRLDEAEELFRQSLALRPQNSQPYLQLGNVFRLRDDHAAAKEWYGKAVQIAPDKFTQNYRLGREHFVLNEFESAERYLTRAVEINPQSSTAFYYLSQAVYQNGRQDDALAILEEAVQLDEGQWSWLVKLGDWRAEAGDGESALEAYRQAQRLQPENPKITAKIQSIENP